MARPFATAAAMFALIAAAMKLDPGADRQRALGAIDPYRSRGHGRGDQFRARRFRGAAAAKRASAKRRNQLRSKGRFKEAVR